jgi:hypothetical protein
MNSCWYLSPCLEYKVGNSAGLGSEEVKVGLLLPLSGRRGLGPRCLALYAILTRGMLVGHHGLGQQLKRWILIITTMIILQSSAAEA